MQRSLMLALMLMAGQAWSQSMPLSSSESSYPALQSGSGSPINSSAPRHLPGRYFPASELPENVSRTALASRTGIYLERAKLSWDNDEGTYVILGRLPGEVWRIKVSSSGQLMSVARDS